MKLPQIYWELPPQKIPQERYMTQAQVEQALAAIADALQNPSDKVIYIDSIGAVNGPL